MPNLIVMGVLESRGESVYWGQWAATMLPVIGLLRVALIYLLIRMVFRLPKGPLRVTGDGGGETPSDAVTGPEKKVLGILIAGVIIWATDAVHGVHPAYVGLALVLVCYLPGWGPLSPALLRKVNFPILIYIAAALAIGGALEQTGFSARAAITLSDVVGSFATGTATSLAALTYTVLPFNFLGDTAAIAAILTPVVLDIAANTGLGALPAALSVAVAASAVCVPYQAAPFVMAYSFRYVGMGQFIRMMTLVAIATLLLLLPLNLLYWRAIGFV